MDCFVVELENSQFLGIPLDLIREVVSITPEEICPIPGVKQNLLGVINQRGKLLWLLDLSPLLSLVSKVKNPLTKLIVLLAEYQQKNFGLVVKNLREIKSLEFLETLDINSAQFPEHQYLKYQTKFNSEDFLNVIDIDAIYNYIHDPN